MPAVQPATAMSQRRHSSASSDAGSDHGLASPSRHTSQENIAIIPTRTTKVVASKPAANPLKFVKVGPCDLSRYAQEQLKKVEEVKKVKPERRDEAEDWQSNLDNWKVSRRKRQEHIIERVVEVKKLELEEHDRNRRRSKTFNEMLEERTSKGRKTSLPVYKDDDNDLSDLGLSTHKNRENGDDSVFDDYKSTSTSRDNLSSASSSVVSGENGTSVNGHHDEEYTYDRAIQNYVNYTESRMRGRSLTPLEDSSNLTNGLSKKSSPPVPAKPRRGSCKIEEKLSELEQIKKKSMSTNDLSENSRKPLSVPKVDILKRREMFEKSQEEETSNIKNRSSGDFGSKSIRDRVTSFGKSSEDSQANKKLNRISGEISVKDRLSSIERQNGTEQNSTSPKSNTSAVNGTAITQSVKDRLSSLQKSSTTETKPSTVQSQIKKDKPKVKEELVTKTNKKENLVSNGENNQIDRVKDNNNKNIDHSLTNGSTKEDVADDLEEKFSPSDDMYESKRQQHYRHRSLDSLDVESNDGVGNESFERVQSLEDLDYCRNYPPSSVSGDTDREDSGIHTADVSSSVSQADDCDLHLDAEFHQQPTILEEMNKNSELTSSLIVKQINQMNVSGPVVEIPDDVVAGPEVVENSSCFLKLPLKLDCDLLPVILESPSEPIPPTSFAELSTSDASASSKTFESSQKLPPSQFNVIDSVKSDKIPVVKSDFVNISCKPENQHNFTLAGEGETLTANCVTVNKSNSLPINLSATEVMHDSQSGDIEISHKIELSEKSTLPLSEPLVSVETEFIHEPEKKFDGGVSEGVHHLTALSVDVGEKQEPLLAGDNLAVFSQTDTKLMEGIEVVFPLSPSILEPPKEKPPPPPMETSDDDDQNITNTDKSVSLRRLDSTKRIKKEIRQKRSSFLGIEGSNDDNYLEPELELVRRPPDISSFLAEEKRLEQQLLYRQSICSESESRDSGVELEKHNDDLTWTTVHHSRDNSETYANTSTTSEEEEIVKKEREILEMLEREEINRYNSTSQEQDNIGEKLAVRLRELEAEKSRLEWERRAEEAARQQHQSRMQARELELSKQENAQDVQELDLNTEMLMAERKRLEAEQASLAHQRDLMLQQQYNHNHNRSLTDVRVLETGYAGDYRRSMTDLRAPEPVVSCYRPAQTSAVPDTPCDNRRSMPDLAARRPPPPIPPAKPLIIPRTQDKRMSSPQQMSRQTLQALAAAPKSRLSDNWLQQPQPRRNPNNKPNNYQHWLVQEAEQRRITELHQRQAPPPRRPVPPPPPQQWGSTPSPQYTNWQPPQRQDKPLPDAIIQSLTQRVQNRLGDPNNNRRRMDVPPPAPITESRSHSHVAAAESQEKMLSVSGKKKCSHCGEELGRGAAMIIESLRLFYHIDCFKCCVCCVQLGDGLMGTDVRVRNNKLHCHNCYSSDDGVKFSCV